MDFEQKFLVGHPLLVGYEMCNQHDMIDESIYGVYKHIFIILDVVCNVLFNIVVKLLLLFFFIDLMKS